MMAPMKSLRKVEELRRKAVACAASCAALAGVPALTLAHGHRWVGFACIGVQVVLLVFSIRFLAALKRARAAAGDAGESCR